MAQILLYSCTPPKAIYVKQTRIHSISSWTIGYTNRQRVERRVCQYSHQSQCLRRTQRSTSSRCTLNSHPSERLIICFAALPLQQTFLHVKLCSFVLQIAKFHHGHRLRTTIGEMRSESICSIIHVLEFARPLQNCWVVGR